MERFEMNGIWWQIIFVDPSNPILIDRTGKWTVACTDPVSKRVFISNNINKEEFRTVITHELGHCAMVSYNLLDEIHSMVKPEYWVEMEEFICNLIAVYGLKIIKASDKIIRVALVKRT